MVVLDEQLGREEFKDMLKLLGGGVETSYGRLAARVVAAIAGGQMRRNSRGINLGFTDLNTNVGNRDTSYILRGQGQGKETLLKGPDLTSVPMLGVWSVLLQLSPI
jgi:hypothetical protein